MDRPELDRQVLDLARRLTSVLAARGLTVGVAESLTGGLLAGALSAVPGASAGFRGGVVAYASDVKVQVLGVLPRTVEEAGVVSDACAQQMAVGARRLLGTDLALATTGVAGPSGQEGKPVGQVHLGVATAAGSRAVQVALRGDRDEVRLQAVRAALELGLHALEPQQPPPGA